MSDRICPGILVVDDQSDLRALLQTVLRHHGFRVILAASGREAVPIYRVKQQEIALVLLDVDMPDWDGPRTLRELRQIRPDVIACFVTGECKPDVHQKLASHRPAALIRKPFEPSDLARGLWGLIGDSDRRDSLRSVAQSTRVSVGSGIEPQQVVESYVGDQSNEGIRLRLPKKLGEVGAILSIRPADLGDEAPWLPVQVRHLRSDAGVWTAGCQFLHPAARPLG